MDKTKNMVDKELTSSEADTTLALFKKCSFKEASTDTIKVIMPLINQISDKLRDYSLSVHTVIKDFNPKNDPDFATNFPKENAEAIFKIQTLGFDKIKVTPIEISIDEFVKITSELDPLESAALYKILVKA